MYFCESLDQWLAPEASEYRGLCVRRPIDRSQYQEVFDAALAAYKKKERGQLQLSACVDIKHLRDQPAALRDEATKKAAEMMEGLDLPEDLKETIKVDAADLFETLVKLLPQYEHMHLKLESFGVAGRCPSWHQDNYVARAIACYCGAGTEYIEDSDFDFPLWRRCRKRGIREEDNLPLIKNRPEVIKSIECGDIMLIKGKQYPGHSGGLLHKSPEPEYYSSGQPMTRLALKVDISASH